MFIFQLCPKVQGKHCKYHYDYDRKKTYNAPPLALDTFGGDAPNIYLCHQTM